MAARPSVVRQDKGALAPDPADRTESGKKPPQVITTTGKMAFWRRRGLLYNERSSWVETWRFLADYFYPRKGRWFITQENRGERRDQKIIDGTTRFAVRDMSAGMMSGITSPARPWFRLGTADKEMMKRADVKEWCYLATERMRELFSQSNFYNVLPSCYGEFGVFGTMALYELEDAREVIRFYPATINSYFLGQGPRLTVDTIYRDLRMTVGQLVTMFGYDKLSTRTQGMWVSGARDQWIDVTHAIEPNDDRNPYMADAKNMPFRSVWFEWGNDVNEFLRISGFHEFPGFAPRWETTGQDVYGVGPGYDALGDAKALMYQQKQKAKAIDKHVDPPMVGSPALKNQRASLLPGDVTYVDMANGMQGFQPAYVIKPEIDALLGDIKEMQERINTAFYRDLFLMLANETRSGITAREIEEKHEEKLLMLGPVLQRINEEMLSPLIERTFSIMTRRGLLPPIPPSLGGARINVEFVSILAQAQKMIGTAANDQFIAQLATVSQTKTAAMQADMDSKVDFDAYIDDYADQLGINPKIVVDQKIADAARAKKAQAAQAQQAAAMAKPVADAASAAKDLSSADMGGDSALTRLVGASPVAPP